MMSGRRRDDSPAGVAESARSHLEDHPEIHPLPGKLEQLNLERLETPQAPSSTIPFSRNPDFVARQTLLEQLHHRCSLPAARTALVGLGGTGKSQLAIEYSYQVRDQSLETWIFWVHASDASCFLQSYRDIADRVKLARRKDLKADILQLVHDWLQDERNGKWFLVLDSVDDARWLLDTPTISEAVPASGSHNRSAIPLWEYLPQSQHGSVLVTTRSRSVALQLVEERDIIVIESIDEPHALALFERKLLTESDREDTVKLVAALGFLPIAIVQAAAYINQSSPRYSVQEYIEKFQKTKTRLLTYDEGHLRRDRDAKNSIITSWQISFDRIQQERSSAADLLSLMSLFDQPDIPESLLRNREGTGNRHSDLQKLVNNNNIRGEEGNGLEIGVTNDFEDDIIMLRNYSFISANVNNATFGMQRPVQLATRKWLEEHGQLERWKQQYIKSLCVELPAGRISPSGDFSDPVEAATAISRDSGYESMISKQLLEGGSDESDAKSMASLESHITSASSLNPAGLGGAEEFAEILLDNDEILQCMKQGFVTMDSDWFERNFIRLLRNYASELRTEADTHVQKSATRIVYNYRAYVTRIIRRRIMGLDENDSQATAFHSIKNQATTKLTLERYLTKQRPAETFDQADARPEDEQESNEDSHSDDEEPDLPNLEKLINFLVSSTAFKNFKARLEAFVKMNSQLQQNFEDSSSRVREMSEPVLVERPKHLWFLKWVKNIVRRLCRSPIPPGVQRIEWICDCGDLLHMDFNSNSIESYPTRNALLNFQSATLLPSGNSHPPSQSQTGAPGMPMQASLRGNMSQNLATQSTSVPRSQSNTPHISSLGAASTASTAQIPSNSTFLELCVNTGNLLKSLGEINVSSITTDGDFFSTVKAHYLRLRSFRARFWLLKPVAVSYVRFSVEDRCRVGILHKPIALPPKTEVDAKRYHYNPCPLENELPISSDLFLHYLFSCSYSSRNMVWLPRIPRKLNTSILTSPALASFGWGVHIDEGPDYLKIFILNLVVLGISGVTALLWEVFRHDIQGAMGIAAWIVLLLNTLMAVFVTKWSQE